MQNPQNTLDGLLAQVTTNPSFQGSIEMSINGISNEYGQLADDAAGIRTWSGLVKNHTRQFAQACIANTAVATQGAGAGGGGAN